MRSTRLFLIHSSAVIAAAIAFAPVGSARQAGIAYAIKGVRVHTVSGAPIAGATVVIRNGLIEDVGASVTAPVDAIAIDGANMNVYPGLIDMASSAPLGGSGAAAGAGGGGGGRGGGAPAGGSFEENERVKRAALLRPDFMAAENLDLNVAELQQWAGAGVTTVLAVPPSGIFKGQSALVNVVIPPDDPQISGLADNRRGLPILKSPVALHVNPAGRGGGSGYPGALLGTIAFTKQGFLDAQWQRDAMAQYQRAGAKGPRPVVEPALDALKPALAREMPTAFDAGEAREIDRALAMAAQFGLDPIVVGASGAAERTAELAKAKARVILSTNFPSGRGGAAPGGGGGGGRGGGGGASLRQMKAQADAPKTPAALAKAGVPFAFTSGGASAADFVRNAGRVIKEGGLAADVVLRALTLDAARLAGAADRLGSIEKGKIANIVVTEGDLFDNGRVRHVFIDGRPVTLSETAPAAAAGRGGRGGQR
jgi:imidazolonepropionase-like amidohydrolase